MEFQDAKVTMANEPEEVRISTDDLVFMLGEAAVKDRQNLKRLTYLDKQVGAARKELLEVKSLSEGYRQKVDAYAKVRESMAARILQMEKQLHDVAVERDTYRNQIEAAKIEATKTKRPKRKDKIVKHASDTSGNPS